MTSKNVRFCHCLQTIQEHLTQYINLWNMVQRLVGNTPGSGLDLPPLPVVYSEISQKAYLGITDIWQGAYE